MAIFSLATLVQGGQGVAAMADGGENAPLRVAAAPLPPWALFDANCRLTGIGVENIRRLAARASLDVEFIILPLETNEAQLIEAGVDLFLGQPAINGPFLQSTALPFGFPGDIVAYGPALQDGTLPDDDTTLRIGARTPLFARMAGYSSARLRTGDVITDLAPALTRGDLDLIIGGREVVHFALLMQGEPPEGLRARTLFLERQEHLLRLLPTAEARWDARLREAAIALDWQRSYRQLRQRFLNPDVVKNLRLPKDCVIAPTGAPPKS